MSDCNTTETSASTSQDVLWPERWIKKRYGLMLFVALLLWPILGVIPQMESLVVNGLLLDSYWQLAYLTIANVVAFFFAVAILRVLAFRNPGGKISSILFGDNEKPWGRIRVVVVASIAALAPLFIALKFGSEFAGERFSHVCKSLLTVSLSIIVGVAGLWILGRIKCWVFGSHSDSANTFPFEAHSVRGFALVSRFSREIERAMAKIRLGNTDLQFLFYLVLLAMVHHQVAHRLETNEYWLTSAPYMLVLFLWLFFMILAGLANWLDRWRLPPLFFLAFVFTILFSFQGSTRSLSTFPDKSLNRYVERIQEIRRGETELLENNGSLEERRQFIARETASMDDDAWSAIQNRMNQLAHYENPKGKTLVIVTCPGGGIHAAAWASCVLDQLSDEYVEFRDSLCIVSGVSGGSVGALLFVGSRYENELLDRYLVGAASPSTEQVHRDLKSQSPALELSARSALESIAFGATVDDLYGLVGLGGVGRGQRLEDSLGARLPADVQSMTMGQWGDRTISGAVPIVVFNSTDAVTGRRVLFDTVPTPWRASSVGLTARPLNYRELLDSRNQAFDVLPATAARTSATFPYISPFTKPSNASDVGNHVALCDGGYVDNEGIVTAVNWIEFILRRWAAEGRANRSFDRILLLRIEPSAIEDINKPGKSDGFLGSLRWLAGPGETMMNVRNASQIERGNLEADLAALFLTLSKDPDGDAELETEHIPRAMKSSWDQASQQNSVEQLAFDKRRLSAQDIRKNWEEMLNKFEASIEAPSIPSQTIVPKGTIDDGISKTGIEPPVIMQTITFVDANQSIPLNWKLSNRQKLGYLLAWKLCSSEGTPLRETLDRYFRRTDSSN
ncbi:hypothetical protein SH449x_003920 [Pirellulaceae bacterium SH449]